MSIIHIISILLAPIIKLVFLARSKYGKEDAQRLHERFGDSTILRPNGFLIWIHAASVGESVSAITLINEIRKQHPNIKILITSGTVSSAKILAKSLPDSVIHQYIVADSYFYVKKFLNHWSPNLGIFIESELWPSLILEAKKYCPLLIMNARLSSKSLAIWKYLKFIIRPMLQSFDLILTQSAGDNDRYKIIGDLNNIFYVGNLKYAKASETQITEDVMGQVADFKNIIGKRPVILIASTHEADEQIIINNHIALKNRYNNLLTIIAPRHPQRAKNLIKLMEQSNITYAQRSISQKLNDNTDIYLADTLGEMQIFYMLADIIFIGGSFSNGGHNPIEAAIFSKIIIFGPDMRNFTEIREDFISDGAAIQIKDENDLTETMDFYLNGRNIENKNIVIQNSKNVLERHSQILHKYMSYIKKYI